MEEVKITAYKTCDGKTFTTLKEAEDHELYLRKAAYKERVEDYLLSNFDYDNVFHGIRNEDIDLNDAEFYQIKIKTTQTYLTPIVNREFIDFLIEHPQEIGKIAYQVANIRSNFKLNE